MAREQFCWTCKHAENSRKCPWAGGKARSDWKASPTVILGSNGDVDSYKIEHCPGYDCDVEPVVVGINPTEAQEQRALIEWAEQLQPLFPELILLTHIPNEGQRSPVTGARLKQMGMRRGFPDLILPVARCGYHGLYVEMKRAKGGHVSEEQRWWLSRLRQQGYRADVCKGAKAAAGTIIKYLLGTLDAESESVI